MPRIVAMAKRRLAKRRSREAGPQVYQTIYFNFSNNAATIAKK